MTNVTNATLKLTEIVVVPEFNSRNKMDGPAINKLASSIQTQGLLHPPTVIPVPKAYQKNGATHLLVAGFRRMEALKKLGRESEDFRVANDIELTDGLLINATENLARKSISRYEIAKLFHSLNEKPHSLTAEQISVRIAGEASENAYDGDHATKLSPSAVGNYIRIFNNLNDEIKEQWAIGHAKTTVKNLLAIVAVKGDEKQMEMWLELTGDGPENDDEENEGGTQTQKTKARPSADKCKLAIAAVKESSHSPEWKEGAIAALRYASGGRKMTGVTIGKKARGGKTGKNGKKKGEKDEK